jgi:hypothetical protein
MGECSPRRGPSENDYPGIEVTGPVGMPARPPRRSLERGCFARTPPSAAGAIPDSSLEAIYVFFPDPWPKTSPQATTDSAAVRTCHVKLRPGAAFILPPTGRTTPGR